MVLYTLYTPKPYIKFLKIVLIRCLGNESNMLYCFANSRNDIPDNKSLMAVSRSVGLLIGWFRFSFLSLASYIVLSSI